MSEVARLRRSTRKTMAAKKLLIAY